MDLDEREGIFSGSGGTKLYYRALRAAQVPFRAVLVTVQDPHDSGPLYPALVRYLAPRGYVLYGFAHRELRRTPRQPGYVEEWNEAHADLSTFLTLVRQQEPDAPLFLAGSHLGAHIVMTYALHTPSGLRGVLALHPRNPPEEGRSSLLSLGEAISRVWPGFGPAQQRPTDAIEPPPTDGDAAGEADAPGHGAEATTVEQRPADLPIPLLLVRRDGGRSAAGSVEATSAEGYAQIFEDVAAWMERHLD